MKSWYVQGKDGNKVLRTARTVVPFSEDLLRILEEDHTIVSCHSIYCTSMGLVRSNNNDENDNGISFPCPDIESSMEEYEGSCSLDLFPIQTQNQTQTQDAQYGDSLDEILIQQTWKTSTHGWTMESKDG
ncbi:hypothetical protein Y1Q_0001088 [Alligator mississippiensis]|uniref:Uncharacterized protein n=1 Tax=Alligator mississippiensis TaxID=8496 RepID=A0A151NEH4_ALLMI|nr:hypothetical protein Y1Q_0001088 [Alligator mississippiensis]